MSSDKYHSEQFERYLKGQMSPEEAHAFEREVLDDPFAQEALEGFEANGPEAFGDLKKLKGQVSEKDTKTFPFMHIAAMIALLILGSFTVYYFSGQIAGEQLAMDEKPIEEIVQSSPAPDTTFTQTKADEEQEVQASELEDEEVTPTVAKVEETEVDDQLAMAREEEEAPVADLEPISVVVEEADLDESALSNRTQEDLSKALQGKVAGVQVTQAGEPPSRFYQDTSQLDEVVITAQPLVAEEREVSSAVVEVDAKEISRKEISKRAKKAIGAVSRSATISETVSGTITDEYGEPLPGVNVVVKGTTTGVISDLDGFFEIPKTDNQTLIFAYVGFETQEIAVGSRSNLDVTLGGATELQEVVVTGYGEQTNDSSPSYKAARPSGGNRAFKKYLEENLEYPEAARAYEIEGTVVLELIVNSTGLIFDIHVKKSLGYGCDKEAIRLVREGPSWEAAEKDGNPVDDKLKVRVKFKLN